MTASMAHSKRKDKSSRGYYTALLFLFLPLLCAMFFCASQLGILSARVHQIERLIGPSQTADYSPWEIRLQFAAINPSLATQIARERGGSAYVAALIGEHYKPPIDLARLNIDTGNGHANNPSTIENNTLPNKIESESIANVSNSNISNTNTNTPNTAVAQLSVTTSTPSPNPTVSPTNTPTSTSTATATATVTPSATNTFTPNFSPTPSPTFTSTFTPTDTLTPTPTFTPSNTPIPAPIANFTISPTSGTTPTTVTVTNTSSGMISAYLWDFGDGVGTSTAPTPPPYTYTRGGIYTITLQVTGPGGIDTQTRIVTVIDPLDIAVSQTVSNPTPIETETITYAITVANNGPYDATNIRIDNVLPLGLAYVGDTPSQGSYSPSTGAWLVGTLGGGASASLQISVIVNNGTGGSVITTTTRLSSLDQLDTNSSNDSQSVTINVLASADISISKTVNNPMPIEGNTIFYTITATNNGPSSTTGLIIADLLPTEVSFTLYTATRGVYNNSTGEWSLGNLGVGNSATLTIYAVVKSGTASIPVTNVADVVSASTGDLVPANDTASATFTSINASGSADLALSMNVSNSTPLPGDAISYSLTLNNFGPNPATGIEVSAPLPAGVTFVSTSGVGVYNSGTGIWSLANLNVGGSATLNINVTVNNGTESTGMSYDGFISLASQADSNGANNLDSVGITVGSAGLSIENSVNDNTPHIGQSIRYTIRVDNDMTIQATNIQVQDVVPSGLTLVGWSSTHGVYNPLNGLWDINALNAGESARLYLDVVVDMVSAGTVITNTAEIIAVDQSDPTGNNLANRNITVWPDSVQLAMTVSNNFPAENLPFSYIITLTNNLGVTATDVQVTDILPAALTFVSSTPSQGAYDDITGIWDVGSMNNGATATLTLLVYANTGTAGTTISNTAAISALNEPDSNTTDDTSTVNITISTADLAVIKSVNDSTPIVGQNITYTIQLYNYLSVPTAVQVTDILDARLQFVSATPSQGAYDNTTGIWDVGTVANGSSAVLQIIAQVTSAAGGTTVPNTATITFSSSPDGNPVNDFASVNITVPISEADIAISKSVDNANPNEGQLITYTITAQNNGPSIATALQVLDLLPSNLTFFSASASAGTYNSSTGIWNIGNLNNGASRTLTLRATVNSGTAGTTIANTATLSSLDQTDNNTTNDSASAVIHVPAADLSITKMVDNSNPYEGDTITYTVTIVNNGPNDVVNTAIVDTLPIGLTYISANATAGSYDHISGVWSVGPIANGASATLTIVASVNTGTAGGTIINHATISLFTIPDLNSANDNASASISVQSPSADISIVSHTVSNANPHETVAIQYDIQVTNLGPNNATGLQLNDLLPTGLSLTSANATSGNYNALSGIWDIGALNNGDNATLTLYATVNAGTAGTIITNTAIVTNLDQNDPNLANDSASAAITVQPATADLSLSKNGPATVSIGDTFDYVLVVTNNGPSLATNVSISDTLPVGIQFVSSPTCSAISQTVTCTLGNVAHGGVANVNITAQANNLGTFINNATVSANEIEPIPTDNSASATINVIDPWAVDYALNIIVDDPNPPVGATITFTVDFNNILPPGTANVDNIEVLVSLPTGLTYTGHTTAFGTYDNATGVWTFSYGSLGSITLDITANVDVSVAGTTLNIVPIITDDSWANDSNGANDSANININVQSLTIDLQQTVATSNTTVAINDMIDFTLTVDNLSAYPASDVVITSALPSEVAIINAPSCNIVAQTVTCIVGTLAGGSSASYVVTLEALASGILTLDATVSSNEIDPDMLNNSDSINLTITP